MTDVLARRDRALSPDETEALLRDRLGDGITGSTLEFGTFTVHVAASSWHAAVQSCRDESLLAYDMFDSLFGIDAREEGFDVVTVLYSTSTGNRICLRTRCDGGRETPVCETITDIYRGADWMERETWDMFGIDFVGHPALEPRLLTVENFEGWPLRKDFHLASRVAKPWPGVNEPAELDEDGNVIKRQPQIGDAPGPYDLDKAMAEQARAVNASAIEAAREADDARAAEGSTPALDVQESEQADNAVDAESETSPSGPGASPADEEPTAAEKADARRKEQAEARTRKAAERTAEESGDDPQLDQETYDRLIAEGKSERIARSKAKAARIKKQRAAEAATDDDEQGDA